MAASDRHTVGMDIRAAVMAVFLTLGLFVLLPYVHLIVPPPAPAIERVKIPVVKLPPVPPALPPPETVQTVPEPVASPQPELETPTVEAVPLNPVLDFDVALASVGGDFGMSFAVEPANAEWDRGPFELGDVDTMPQAVVQMRPFYPSRARRRRIEGEVTVLFTVTSVGDTDDVRVIRSSPDTIFNEAAIRAVRRWQFTPAIKDEEPVAVRVRQVIRFRMED